MVGTIEEALDMKRRPQMDEMTDWERKTIGSFIRIEIPMTDIYKLRKVAELLRGLADHIDNHTRRSDLSVKSILVQLKHDAKVTTMRIKDLFPEVFRRRFIEQGEQD